jgi:hypothetical protein
MRKAVGLAMIVGGIALFATSFRTSVQCPWDQQTPAQCQKGELGQVSNDDVVTLASCAQGPANGATTLLTMQSGLTVNGDRSKSCRKYDCSGCLKTEVRISRILPAAPPRAFSPPLSTPSLPRTPQSRPELPCRFARPQSHQWTRSVALRPTTAPRVSLTTPALRSSPPL